MFECTGIDVENLNTYHIGFVIGPCINACGRLDTAKRALELLNAPGRREAVMMAEDLKALNESRKEMTEKGVERAVEMIAKTVSWLSNGTKVLLIARKTERTLLSSDFRIDKYRKWSKKDQDVPLKHMICLKR